MALRARRRHVRSGQRESCARVIECRVPPRCGVVARGTSGGNSRLRMVRVGRALVVLHVARSAVRTTQVEIPVGVALRTLQRGVRPSQSESNQRVIERSRLPCGGVVAALAGLREIAGHMIRVRRLLKIGQVAAGAGGGRALEFSSDMAGQTI